MSAGVPAPYVRSFEPQISGDGRLVAFHSDAGLAPGGSPVAPSDVYAARVPGPPECFGKPATALAVEGALTRGTPDRDVVVGGDGADQLKLGKGRDLVCSGDGKDDLVTGGDRDKVKAGGGADTVSAGGDDDNLSGNGGRDRLDGGGGDDKCNGGGGKDKLKRCERGSN